MGFCVCLAIYIGPPKKEDPKITQNQAVLAWKRTPQNNA